MSEKASLLEPSVRCALADRYAHRGHFRLAAELYRDLARDVQCPIGLLPSVASGLGRLGEYEAALEVCAEMVHRDSTHHEGHFGVAFYLRRLGLPAESAIPSMTRAHELAPDRLLYRLALASLLDQVGQREDAFELLRDVDLASLRCRCCLWRVSSLMRAEGVAPHA